MNVQDAAMEILKGAGKPLHAKEIAERIIAAGLWHSEGKTPDATVSARLYSDIKNNGERSAFVKVGPQTFALRNSVGTLKNARKSVPPSVEKIQKSPSANAGLSFNDCAQKVLDELSMSFRDGRNIL